MAYAVLVAWLAGTTLVAVVLDRIAAWVFGMETEEWTRSLPFQIIFGVLILGIPIFVGVTTWRNESSSTR